MTNTDQLRQTTNKPGSARLVHFAAMGMLLFWTGLAAYKCYELSQQTGHPPGSGFIPFVGLGWLIGAVIIIGLWAVLSLVLSDPSDSDKHELRDGNDR